MSSRADFPITLRMSGPKGPKVFIRRNRAGRRKPSRLGSPAKSGSLSPDPNRVERYRGRLPTRAVPASFASLISAFENERL
jgi:hypothetical protein